MTRSILRLGPPRLAFILASLLIAAAAGAQTVIALDPALNEFPEGVAIDKPGNIWMTVQPLCEVRRYTPTGTELLRVRLVAEGCINANGLAVDATGNAYAAVGTTDEATRGVYMIEPNGAASYIAGSGQIASPNALAFDHHNGTLYVTDMTAGAVWRVTHQGVVLWVQDPALTGTLPPPPGAPFPPDFRLGANGIAFRQGAVYVAVTWVPRIVRIAVNRDGSAGTPEVLVPPPAFFAKNIFALDGLALDVFGNFFAASPSNIAIVRVSKNGTDISLIAGVEQGVTAAPLSLAFGTGKGDRQNLFVTISPSFGGVGSGLVRVYAGTAGLPLP